MAKSKIAIIGLGLTGSSMGMAMQREPIDFEIVGHDRDPEVAAAAKRQGSVGRTEWNLHNACAGASLIIIAIPLDQIPEVLEQIADDMAPGSVLFAMSDVMQPMLDFAQRVLPERVHFVVGHPIYTGVGMLLDARADLFDGIQFCIGSNAATAAEALDLVNNLVIRVGATPLYMDVAEHDGIASLVEHLPQLLGAALMSTAAAAPGWQDSRKVAGKYFANATKVGENGSALARTLFVNRENLLRSLERYQAVLDTWREFLSSEDETKLTKALITASEERLRWETQAQLKDWDRVVEMPKEDQPGLLRQMFFGGLRGNRNRAQKPSQE